jgi:DNA-binding transcriptional regulator YiaG
MRRSQDKGVALIRELTLRDCRLRLGLSQRQMAARLAIGSETCRVLDSGRRQTPIAILARARSLVAGVLALRPHHPLPPEPQSLGVDEPLMSLAVLADIIGVHVRTLWNAAKRGQLTVEYDTRTTFRQLRGRSTLTEARRYRDQNYDRRRSGGSRMWRPTWEAIPRHYDVRVRLLRRRMRLTQGAFARQLGAANKAVIYQWESRKRCPSPVFWQRIEALQHAGDP